MLVHAVLCLNTDFYGSEFGRLSQLDFSEVFSLDDLDLLVLDAVDLVVGVFEEHEIGFLHNVVQRDDLKGFLFSGLLGLFIVLFFLLGLKGLLFLGVGLF